MISQIEMEAVHDFLNQSTGTLENIQKSFGKKFTQEFQPFYFLYQGLCDNLFTRSQRYIAIYIIHQSEMRQILTDIYNYTIDQFERKFITNPDPYAGLQIKTLIEEADKYTDRVTKEIPTLKNMNQLRDVVPNSTQLFMTDPPNQNLQLDKFKNEQGFVGFELDFLRPIPTILKQEFNWMDVNQIIDIQWNYTLQINIDKLSQVKEIMQKAQQVQISDQEIKLLQDYIKDDPYLLNNCGFSSNILPDLIEKNTSLAVFLIVENYQSQYFQDFLDTFIQIEVTQNSMEVLSLISTSIRIPVDFLTYYVLYCIQKCKNIREKGQQHKLVRFVCVFAKVMIKAKQINQKDVLTELQAFCIEFSKVAEASNLFKLIKQNPE